MPATPESILRAWFDGLWNRGDEDTINRLMHPDGLIHGLPTPDGQFVEYAFGSKVLGSKISCFSPKAGPRYQ